MYKSVSEMNSFMLSESSVNKVSIDIINSQKSSRSALTHPAMFGHTLPPAVSIHLLVLPPPPLSQRPHRVKAGRHSGQVASSSLFRIKRPTNAKPFTLVADSPHTDVFGRWKEAEEPGENPRRHRENNETPLRKDLGDRTRNLHFHSPNF